MESQMDTQTLLANLDGQPDEVRRVFIYAICETMVRAGALEFVGASTMPGFGTTLLYRNPDTQEVFEIVKPEMSPEEEAQMRQHIDELLETRA